MNSAGNGFITLIGEEKAKYYVEKDNLNFAQNSDIVEFFALSDIPSDKLIDAVVNSIIEHGKNAFVGEFNIKEDGKYNIKLDDNKSSLIIILDDISG